MPKEQSLKILRPARLSSLFVLVIMLAFSACKGDKQEKSIKDLYEGPDKINFLINGEEITGPDGNSNDKIGVDFPTSYYYENKQNPEIVHLVPTMDSVIFKDISQFSEGAPGERQWFLDGQPLGKSGKEVAIYSEVAGTSEVILKFNDQTYVRKGIYFTDVVDYSEDFATVDTEEEPMEEETEEMAMVEETEKTVRSTPPPPPSRKKTNTNTNNSSRPAKNTVKSTPPPPPPAEIERVDFKIDKLTAETGEKIFFTDASEPAIAVKNRVWDWGDGITSSTRGRTFGYSYSKPGNYTVKLCLNYSSKCTTKTIKITKAEQVIVEAPPKATPPPEVKKAEVSKVVINSASKTIVGKPIEVKDDSYPGSAVTSRSWYVNGKKENFTSSKFSKTFDKPGNYTIKLCVNGETKCTTKVITIEDKPKPVETASTSSSATSNVDEEFFAMATSRTGLRTSQRCPEDNAKWFDGKTEVTLTPKVMLELMSATYVGKKIGKAKITLRSADGKVNEVINNSQILPNTSTIELGDFTTVLQPGTTYTLTVEPMSGSEVLLEDGGNCNTSFAADERLGVSYKDNVMTLYNLKFAY